MDELRETLANNLLELDKKNKLLNFRDYKLKSIELVKPSLQEVFDMVSKNSKISLVNLDIVNKKNKKKETVSDADLIEQLALKKNEVIAYKKDLDSQIVLKKILECKKEFEKEKGLNTLYLTFGLLKWCESSDSDIFYNAPILLAPVNIEYDSINKTFSLKRLDDDIVLNPTLKFKMLKEFGLALPEFDDGFRTIDDYLSFIEEKILLEWKVLYKTFLGIFSFSKITMYNDLMENYDEMISSELVNSMYHNDKVLTSNDLENDYGEFFKKGEDVDLFNVVNADSSQLEAIVEAKKGKSFVIQGPPGTGKSQTITNLIAELIHDGKKVLFVSEKKAALDVVYNNLSKVNLEKFCIQIHSDKSIKREFIDDLYKSMENIDKEYSERVYTLSKLRENKRRLDDYIALLYRTVDTLNLRIHDVIERTYKYKKQYCNDYKIKNISEKTLDYLYEAIEKISLYERVENSENLLFNLWLGFDVNLDINDDELNRRISTALKYIKDIKTKYDELSDFFDSDFETLDEIKNNAFYLKFIKDLPCGDIKLLLKETRENISTTLSKIKLVLSQINKIEENLLTKFNKEIFDINYKEELEKFLNLYDSPFRVFNFEYKKDIAKLRKHLLKPRNIKYNEAVEVLNLIKKRNEASNELKTYIDKMKWFTDYDYHYDDFDFFSNLQTKVNEYVKTYGAFPFKILKFESIDKVIELSKQLLKLLDESNDWKIRDFQSLFNKKFFDVCNLDINKTITRINSLSTNYNQLADWRRNYLLVNDLNELGIVDFLEYAKEQSIEKSALVNSFKYAFYNSYLTYITEHYRDLRDFRREKQDLAVANFVKYDENLLRLNRIEIRNTINQRINNYIKFGGVECKQNILTLKREALKKKMLKSIRQLMEEIPDLIFVLKPCFLMSPLSVSTYLKFDTKLFDVVIFDEASQIFPWDAIGAISRSKSTIIVGDSKQMPPTNFFLTNNSDTIDESEEDVQDFESILDLSCTCLPQIMLKWHYRSNDESLIAFSNKNFYENKLITFPTPFVKSDKTGIHFHYVKEGVYSNNQNKCEAERVVQLVLKFAEKYPHDSVGVVCFNLKQQDLIIDYIEKYRSDPRYINFFKEDKDEPFFVKNLETVQGDERDRIIFSIGYGKDAVGNLAHRFGPLNRKGGERRLNVAVTRAKNSIEVVSSIRGSDINLQRTQSLGVKLLKDYLNLAEKGISTLNDDIVINNNALPESYFEEQVYEFIASKGYPVVLQVGSSGFRIDIGVKHPTKDDFVLAVECDGETYHSSRTARERDKIRQQMLERQGWKFYRIWSTDWFNNKNTEENKLIEAIENAISEYDRREKILNEDVDLKEPVINPTVISERTKDSYELPKVSSDFFKTNVVEEVSSVSFSNNLETEFYKEILRKIKDPNYKIYNREHEIIINEIIKYFFDMLLAFENQDKKIVSQEDFYKRLYEVKHTYRFFEFTFGLSTITIEVVRELYIAFVASKLIEVIKQREQIFKQAIILKGQKFNLLKSIMKKLKTDDYNISTSDGLASTISYIPNVVFETLIKQYKKYITE